jgi:hypothetical protein
MPTVGDKKFPYTPAGKSAAAKARLSGMGNMSERGAAASAARGDNRSATAVGKLPKGERQSRLSKFMKMTEKK